MSHQLSYVIQSFRCLPEYFLSFSALARNMIAHWNELLENQDHQFHQLKLYLNSAGVLMNLIHYPAGNKCNTKYCYPLFLTSFGKDKK